MLVTADSRAVGRRLAQVDTVSRRREIRLDVAVDPISQQGPTCFQPTPVSSLEKAAIAVVWKRAGQILMLNLLC